MTDLDAYAAALLRVVDDIAAGCAIFTCCGTLIATSPGLARTLADTHDAACVIAESSAMARVLGASAQRGEEPAPGAGSASGAVDTPAGRYELAASLVPVAAFDLDRTVLVTVRFTAAPRTAAALAEAFRLTPREVEIAQLIAEGDSNQRIADRLQLSVRTVHHHTERVLRKLGVRGRAGVASRIFKA
ncbi:MAG TPA: LuxR C-terminal-related transcriptional regulator [Gemmatimonadaceae bacterium]|nr:LuxR C-terminal-related transcriptional regulator [Gemmatimonadaceae bacterium]